MTKSPWKHFTLDELKCKCGKCGSTGLEMKTELMEPIELLRERLGFPFVVTSGFRCPVYNRHVGGALLSAHCRGEALDLQILWTDALKLVAEALKFPVFMGFGINQKGEYSSRFIHLDITPRDERIIWSY